ncbi:MAG: cell wall-binding repeat-containing protein, partial [Actinobacteria bacterium]
SMPATVAITVSPVYGNGIAGADRYATSIAMSQEAFPEGSDSVIVATGKNFPDALAASGLAGACDAPILLIPPTGMSPGLGAEIARLGATKAYIVGGTGAVSAQVYESVRTSLGGSQEATRLAGANRYATADAVAREAIEILKRDGGHEWSGRAFLATGRNYPDALVAGPVTHATGRVLLLTDTELSAGTAALLSDAEVGVTTVTVLGAVSVGAQTAAEACTDVDMWIVGDDRYGTCCVFADQYGGPEIASWDRLGIATGWNYPDALAAAPLLGRAGSLLLITPSTYLNGQIEGVLTTQRDHISDVYFLGGPSALSPAVRDAVGVALE